MKIDARKEFLDKLSILKPAIAKAGMIPGLSHIWFDGEYVSAFNGGLGIQIAMESDLKCGVPGEMLLRLLGTSTLSTVSLNPVNKGEAVEVLLGRAKSVIGALEPDQSVWPFPDERTGSKLKVDELMIEGLRKCLMINPSPATRLEHKGVIVVPVDKSSLYLYTTDSKSMVRVHIEQANTLKKPVLLPRELVKEMVDDCPAGAIVYVADEFFVADADGISIYCNALDTEELQDLNKVVASVLKKHGDMAKIPAGFASAVDRAAILAGEDDPDVTITIDGKAVKMTGKYSQGTNELAERMVLEEEFGQAEIKVNSVSLKGALVYGEKFSIEESSLIMTSGEDWLFLAGAVSREA